METGLLGELREEVKKLSERVTALEGKKVIAPPSAQNKLTTEVGTIVQTGAGFEHKSGGTAKPGTK